MNTDALAGAVARLFDLLREREVDYVLVGGVAMLQYVEGRNTQDIDLIMTPTSLAEVPEIQVTGEEADFRTGSFEGVQIDILLTTNPLFDLIARDYAVMQRFVEKEIRSATVSGLLLLKMYALPSLYRQGKFARVNLYEADIAALIHEYKPDIKPLFEELSRHVLASDLESVREIVGGIRQRIQRFDENSREQS